MGQVLIRKGNIFEGGADLTVIPCSAKGTVSSTIRRWLSLFNIPSPLDLQLQLRLGDISDPIPFPGSKGITKHVVFAASVLNDYSSPEAIESISHKLGTLTKLHSNIQLVEAPLLGTGAGGLGTEVSGEALYKGFNVSSAPGSTLYIFVFDTDRFNVLNDLAKRLEGTSVNGQESVFSILFLSADPTNASRLRLGEELREIHENLQLSKHREKFILDQRMSVRSRDISLALLNVLPKIVHFSGHGTSEGALCFEDQTGKLHPVTPDALSALFEQFADQVDCVVLNACFSEIQAQAIAKHINFVIGMKKAIGDRAAIAFAIGFYQAVGAGRTVEEAYKLGCVQIGLQGIPEQLTPVLIKREG